MNLVSEWEDHKQDSIHHSSMRELGEQIELVVWNVSLRLVKEKTNIVNNIPMDFIIADFPVLVVTIAANIWAILIINRKETSRINRLDILYSFILFILLFAG